MHTAMKRRQAIVVGLAPLLGEEQIAVALEIHDRNFADAITFNLQKYVDRLHERLAPLVARRDLQRALVKSVFLGEGGEAHDPAPAHSDAAPAVQVFEALLGRFLGLVAAHRPAAETAVRGYLIDKLATLRLAPHAHDALLAWLARRQSTLTAPLTRDGMRKLLNLTYVLVCEYLGPVVADRLLAQAVKETEALPQARGCAPRALL